MPRSLRASREAKERQRANLLGAARRLFLAGDSPLTMEALAKEAGVSQGLAYRYFPSKVALFRTLLEEAVRSSPLLADRIDLRPGGPRERLTWLVERLLERRRQNPEFYRFVIRVTSERRLPGALRRAMLARAAEIQRRIRGLVVAAQRAGELGPDDPDEIVTALLGCLEGVWRRSTRDDAGSSPAHLPRAEIVLRLLGPAPTRPADLVTARSARPRPSDRGPGVRSAPAGDARAARCEPLAGPPSSFSMAATGPQDA
ncbi:MAG: TetR/AcrR family transcriptional regulator [Thermoplasmata archaeon]